jgi:Polyketide cyclase / dehydrase and lipid transport
MAEIHVQVDSDLPPQVVLDAATEFSQERLELWPTIDPAVYAVEAVEGQVAIVREGSDVLGGIWAKEKYDWSEPGVVRAIVQESNVFRSGGTWELHARSADGGGSHLELVWNRTGKGVKGRFLVLVMRLAGRQRLRSGLLDMLRVLEKKTQERTRSVTPAV